MNFNDLYKKIKSIDEGVGSMAAAAQQQMANMQAKMPNLDPATMMKNQQARMAAMKAKQATSSPGTWTPQGVPAAATVGAAAPTAPTPPAVGATATSNTASDDQDWEESVEECGDMSTPPIKGDSPLMGECGVDMMMPHSAPKQSDSVTMNVSMNGSGPGGIRDLMNILRNLEGDSAPARTHDAGDIADKLFGGDGIEVAFGEEQEAGGFQDATTEPDEQVAPMSAVTPTGNDMHSKGAEAEKVNGGGNPFNVSEALVQKLSTMYNEVKTR